MHAHKFAIRAALVTPDGRHAVTAGEDKMVCVWDLATGKLARTWGPQAFPLTSLAMTPDGKQVLFAGLNMPVRISDFCTGTVQQELTQLITDMIVAVSPDGSYIVTAGHGWPGVSAAIRIFDAGTRTRLLEIDGHVGTVQSVAITMDSSYLITAGSNGFLHVWNPHTGEKVASWSGDSPVRYCAVVPASPFSWPF